MPNRIIKESLCTSEKIAKLTDFEFRLWTGLIVSADDYGRGDARPAIIKGRIFPLRERVTVKDIDNALHGLAAAGCVSLYTVDGRPYYAFPTWAKHQRVRKCVKKFPSEDEADVSPQLAANCGELPRAAASCGLNPESRIQSESESESESESNTKSAHAREKKFSPPTTDEVAEYCRQRRNGIDPEAFVAYYESTGWMVGKKPMKNWKAAVVTWEIKRKTEAAKSGNPFLDMLKEDGFEYDGS